MLPRVLLSTMKFNFHMAIHVKEFGDAERRVTGRRRTVSPNTVAVLLPDQGYSLQSPRKAHESAADHSGRR